MGIGAVLQGLGAELPREAWTALLRAGVARRFETGEVLMRQGDPGTYVLALTAGRVKVIRLEPDGSELLLAVRGPGEVIGVISVMDGGGRSASVTAVDRCLTYMLPAERFRRVISESCLHDRLLRHVLARNREGDALRAELARSPTLHRVALALLRYAAMGTSEDDVRQLPTVGLSQYELALSIGLSRSALAADLAELRKRGLVSTGRRRIEIRDTRGLRRLGDAEREVEGAPPGD